MNFAELTPYDYFLSSALRRVELDEVRLLVDSGEADTNMKRYYNNILNRENVKTFLVKTDSKENMDYIRESLESYFADVGTILNYSYKLLKKVSP